ncbi:MAG: hypothetical protein HZA93_08160 [Verrucomicrobia bacterium]|nr:hypothetical protein [Verrucomicrobiota bacterium]
MSLTLKPPHLPYVLIELGDRYTRFLKKEKLTHDDFWQQVGNLVDCDAVRTLLPDGNFTNATRIDLRSLQWVGKKLDCIVIVMQRRHLWEFRVTYDKTGFTLRETATNNCPYEGEHKVHGFTVLAPVKPKLAPCEF